MSMGCTQVAGCLNVHSAHKRWPPDRWSEHAQPRRPLRGPRAGLKRTRTALAVWQSRGPATAGSPG
eukprot:355394-Chlamydomonas_euryale.AAC.1